MPPSSRVRLLAGLALLPLLLPAQAPASDPACRPADPPAVCQQLAAQVAILDDPTTKAVWDELLATARLAERYPKSPGAWLALAQARRAAHELRMKALRGPRQTAGESFAIGVGNALIRALELDSTDAAAAAGLQREVGVRGDDDSAADALQDCRLRILRALPGLREPARPCCSSRMSISPTSHVRDVPTPAEMSPGTWSARGVGDPNLHAGSGLE